MPEEEVLCSGVLERIGHTDATLRFSGSDKQVEQVMAIESHSMGLNKIAELILDPEAGPIDRVDEIDAIGHRVVHGGTSFSETCLINDAVKQKIEQSSLMAPLHNPHNLNGIRVTENIFPNARQVAVFDTAFHQTIPVMAHKYPIPNELYDEHHLRVYGFHGTSHAYVVSQAMDHLSEKSARIISVHLGNGCSITAVKNGKSVDTSLGFAPSNGLIMGTRSGDIDHSLIYYMVDTLGYSLAEVKSILDTRSGMLGLTGYSDLREIQAEAEQGNEECILALQMNAYRIKKYIGAYVAAMNGLDALIFTAGIGENSSLIRKMVCEEMEYFGIGIDLGKNESRSKEVRYIDSGDLPVRILVIPTNEELQIARETYSIIK